MLTFIDFENGNHPEFEEWIENLKRITIEDYGYEEGEFDIYPSQWWPLFERQLTPMQAWLHALRLAAERRKEEDTQRTSLSFEDVARICKPDGV